MDSQTVEILLQKLNDLPATDMNDYFDFDELSMPLQPGYSVAPLELFAMNENLEFNNTHNGLTMDFKEEMFSMYPQVPSPPETPLRAITSQDAMQFDWNSNLASPVTQFQTFNHQQGRTMSMPHIGQLPFMQTPKRKSSVSSACSTGSDKDKIFSCAQKGCGRTFSRIQNMRSHMRCHLATAPHDCKLCGIGFRRTTDLQRHIRTVHVPNDQKPWACPKCPKRFGRSDALKRHMASKSKEHGCPGGPDFALIRQNELQKAQKKIKTLAEKKIKAQNLESIQEAY
jgi:hypothetical protein